VAQDCGYADQAAFTRQFHRSVGLTPMSYRKAHSGGREAPALVMREPSHTRRAHRTTA
jgi:AraC-like DNA-binding protein